MRNKSVKKKFNFHEIVAACNIVQSYNLHQLCDSFLMIFQSDISFYQCINGTSPTIDSLICNCSPSNNYTYLVKQVYSRNTVREGGGDWQETLRLQNPILASLFQQTTFLQITILTILNTHLQHLSLSSSSNLGAFHISS